MMSKPTMKMESAVEADQLRIRALESKLHAELRAGYDAVPKGKCLTRDEMRTLRLEKRMTRARGSQSH